MTNERPRRAAIIGFHGFGNLGDEAILAGIEVVLAPLPIRVDLLFGGPGIEGSGPFPAARRMTPPRLMPTLATVRALRRVDLLVLGGGGLFNDHWPLVIPRYLAWVVAARIAGARVAWLGVGVGPIRRRPWLWMAQLAARLSATVLVRDEGSVTLLGGARPRLVPDPAIFLPPRHARRGPTLGLIVRPPLNGNGDELLDLLSALADAGRAAGLAPCIMLMAPSIDAAFAARVGERLRAPIEPLGPTPDDALGRISECTAIASVRLHGLLLSAVAGTPCVPIAYDRKVEAAAARLDLADLVLDWGEGVDRAGVALRQAGADDRVQRVASRVDEMRAAVDRVREMVME